MYNEFRNYYNDLDLPKDGKYEEGIFKGYYISQDGIEKALERIRKQFGRGSSQEARAQEAYNVLTDPEKRAAYNAQLEEYIQNSKNVSASVVNSDIKEEKKPVVPTEEETEEKKPVVPTEEKIEEKKPVVPTEEKIEEKKPVVPTEEKPEEKKPVVPTEEEKEEQTKKDDFKKINNLEDEIFAKDAEIKAANKKRIINNSLIIGASTLFGGPLGTLISTIILKKKGKLKLQKLASKGRIKEIKTAESEMIEKENKTLENAIDELLNSPLKDNQSRYKLEIAKLRYEHQVNLLAKRIEFKKEQKSQLGGKAYNRLYILALEMKYAAAIKSLELRKKKAEAKLNVLNSYNPNENRMDRLTKIQKEIGDTTKELQNSKLSDFGKNHKLAKLNRLNTKKLRKINKMALKKNGISRRQVLLAVLNSPKNWFSHDENQTEEFVDLNSFSGKVR